MDIKNMTSEQIRKEYLNVPIPEVPAEEDFTTLGLPEPEGGIEVEMEAEAEAPDETLEEKTWIDKLEQDQKDRERWQQEGIAYFSQTGKSDFPQFEVWRENKEFVQPQISQSDQVLQGVSEDFFNLKEQYGEKFVSQFADDLKFNRFKSGEDLGSLVEKDNALEEVFLEWVSQPRIRNRMSSKELGQVIQAAAEGPLRTNFLDVMIPQRKPVKPTRQKSERVPIKSYSQEEMMAIWQLGEAEYKKRNGNSRR